MSREIICPQCQSANTPGSKFCNNCGNRLPPSTSLICPNCKTPNPRDRFYCDNCGTRLVQEQQTPKEPEEKPRPQTGTFFSLPARPPGQTGELDPLQIVPDWLRKQAEEEEKEDEEDLRLRMPKIEEIGSTKKVTDDLPDWLVDDEDSESIIGSPRVITTEHFMNLVQHPDQEDEDDEELSKTADKANLPDWLSDLAGPAAEDKVTHSDDLSTPDDALQEWLANLAGGQKGPEPAEADDLADQLARLSQSDDSADWIEEEAKEEITTDWLLGTAAEPAEADWQPPETDSLSGLEVDDQAMGGEMFDWLTETLADSGMLDASAVADSEPEADAGEDWLADYTDADEAARGVVTGWLDEDVFGEAEAGTLAEPAAEDDADEMARGVVTGWLDEDAFGEAEAGILAEPAAGDDASEELPDWLSDMTAEDEEATPAPPESQPDWMAEFTTADSDTFAEEIESKLEALEEKEFAEPAEEDWAATDEDAVTDADESFEAALPAESGSLPDWLSDLGDEETLVAESGQEGDIFTDLFTPAAGDSGFLDWITEEEPEEPKAEVALPPADEAEEEPAPATAEADWFSEMMRLGEEAFAAEEGMETAVPDHLEPAGANLFAADWPIDETDEDEVDEAREPETIPSDLFAADTMLIEALGEELPDWLEELGPPAAGEKPNELDEEAIPAGESMPDWIAQMKPGTGFSGAGLTDSSGLPDLAEAYADLPGDLVGPELPDWLQGAGEIAASPMPPLEESADIPEWLAESMPAESEFSAGRLSEGDEEWTTIFQDLPSAAPIEERVFKADIPDWILALKPGEVGEEIEEEVRVQEGGPLAGIRDVIEIEPIVVGSRHNGVAPPFSISQEQMSQATLLKQLALADRGPAYAFKRTETASLGVVRLLLAALLIAAIVLGLFRPNLFQPAPQVVPAPLAAAHAAIEDAAGAPVLLAVEYTPAMSGELDPQAEMILAQLAASGSPVVTVSQSAAGTAVSQRIAAEHPTLGLLPGQSVGLRQLGDCLAGNASCETLAGRTLTESLHQSLNDVALIIILTGDRDSLLDWLEQVAIFSDVPVVAGVTQSLAPVALPYLDTAQLQGMIGGLPETAVYQQQLLNQTPDANIMRQLSAQTLGQLLAATLLLVGGLFFIVYNWLKRGDES